MMDLIKEAHGIGMQVIKFGEEYWQVSIIAVVIIIGYVGYKLLW